METKIKELIKACKDLERKVALSEERTKELQKLASDVRNGRVSPDERDQILKEINGRQPTVTTMGDEVNRICHLVRKINLDDE